MAQAANPNSGTIEGQVTSPGRGPDSIRWARKTLQRLIIISLVMIGAALIWASYVALLHGYAAGNSTLVAEGTFGGALVAVAGGLGAVWAYFLAIHPGFSVRAPGISEGGDADELSPVDERP